MLSNKTRTTTASFDFGNNQIANLRSEPTENRLSLPLPFFTEDIAFLLRINMQGTRSVSETTSAFESNVLRHIVRRHCSLFPFPFQTPVFSYSLLPPPPLTHRTWYMKHIALPSDGMILTQPPSREIMPRDPMTPDHIIFLPLLSVWIILSLQSSFVIVSTISMHRQMYFLRSSTKKIIGFIKCDLTKWVKIYYRKLHRLKKMN